MRSRELEGLGAFRWSFVRENRGLVRAKVGVREISVGGEALLEGNPDFIIYARYLKTWNDGTPLTEAERTEFLDDLLEEASRRGWKFEVAWLCVSCAEHTLESGMCTHDVVDFMLAAIRNWAGGGLLSLLFTEMPDQADLYDQADQTLYGDQAKEAAAASLITEFYRREADSGDLDALGRAGRFLGEDDAEAARAAYQQAIGAGHEHAMLSVARLTENHLGDEDAAPVLLQQAADSRRNAGVELPAEWPGRGRGQPPLAAVRR